MSENLKIPQDAVELARRIENLVEVGRVFGIRYKHQKEMRVLVDELHRLKLYLQTYTVNNTTVE